MGYSTTADTNDALDPRESLHALQRERRTRKAIAIALIPIGLIALLLATLLAYTQTPGQDQKDVVDPAKLESVVGQQ